MSAPRRRSPRRPGTRARVLAVSLPLVAVTLGACAPAAPEGSGSGSDDDRSARIAAIRTARAALEQPVTSLLTAGAATTTAVAGLRLEPPVDPAAAADESDRIDRDLRTRLRRAVDAAAAVDLDGPTADVAAARSALDDAVVAARNLHAAAGVQTEQVRLLASVDVRLAAQTTRWSEPGSFSSQIARLEEIAAAASGMADELGDVAPTPACSDALARRIRAARAVERTSRELRDLVAARRGEDFDARLRALVADPYGLAGRPLATGIDADCWARSRVVTAAADVRTAVTAIERALDPPELRG